MSKRACATLTVFLMLTAACGEDESRPDGAGGTGTGTTTGTGTGGTGTGTGGTGTATGTGSGTSTGTATGTGSGTSTGTGTGGASSEGFACQYPRDVGIEGHSSVVWAESFEEGSVSAVLSRYDDHKNDGDSHMLLDGDVPGASAGTASMRLTAGEGSAATDFFKNFGTGWDELFVRYYVKYQENVEWHHTGVWVGGYRPATNWPNPQAGTRPNGDDRFSVSIEPMGGGTNPRLDFYNYWMGMQTNPGGGYWGNTLIHDAALIATHGWQCVEIHIKANPDAGSAAGAELGIWRDDESIVQYDDQGPIGRWLHDKFCRETADSPSCTDYTVPPPDVVLDLQWRTTTDLKINYFWPQNYITSGPAGNVWYDDMVLATERIGCICPG